MTLDLPGRLRAAALRPVVQDAGLAFVMFVATLVLYGGEDMAVDSSAGAWWFLSLIALAAVVLRRRWPMPMLVVCTVTALGHNMGAHASATPIDLATVVLVGTVASRHGRRASIWLLVAMMWVATAAVTVNAIDENFEGGSESVMLPGEDGPAPRPPEPRDIPDVITIREEIGVDWTDLEGLPVLWALLVAGWAFGDRARTRRAYLEELQRERDQRAALAVAAERARISRELHDVVAHGLSVMVVQAQGGEAALDKRPADTRAALTAIIDVGRRSLADMRRALSAVGKADEAWEPPPGLAGLPDLVERVRAAGTPVEFRVEGEPAALPSTVDLSAYRIVQEALTNAVKHAGPRARVAVTLAYGESAVRIEVVDDGRGPSSTAGTSGNGLRGMRERADLLGGELAAGPEPGGGFAVRAVLPIEGSGT